MMKRCVTCGSDRVREADLTETNTVGDFAFECIMPGHRCDNCGEEYYDGPVLEQFDVRSARWLAEEGVNTPETFRFMRKAIGLRALDLAELLDVSAETISHWETGKYPLPRNAAALLAAMVIDHAQGQSTTADRLRKLQEQCTQPRKVKLPRCA